VDGLDELEARSGRIAHERDSTRQR
jgi:hypothetical protein